MGTVFELSDNIENIDFIRVYLYFLKNINSDNQGSSYARLKCITEAQ